MVYFTSILLAIPCIWMALALSDGGTSYLQVIIAAGFSGAARAASTNTSLSEAYPIIDHDYDAVVVGAGGAGTGVVLV